MSGSTLLFDAIERYYALMTSDDAESRRAFADLHAWFESRKADRRDSFERLCHRHSVDARAIRRMLQQRRVAATRS